jgi:2-oxoisovalerate dehydrogenase E2 component (dihydrolipoyl transacylase)
MPDIGEGIVEVELVAWRVKPGDRVLEDQILADVMTDKATVEIPSPVRGQVLALGGEAGALMAVGSELIRIELEGAAPVEAAAIAASTPKPSPAAVPQVRASAPTDSKPAAPTQTRSASESSAGRAIASPSVRRRAWELGLDLQQVPASGPGGRVMQQDLDDYVANHGGKAPPAAPKPAPVRAAPSIAARDDVETVKITGLRRKIAEKMQLSKRRIPHFSYVEEVDVTELEALRAKLNTAYAPVRGRLTLLPLLVRAIVLALRQSPQINATLDDENGVITRYGAVHMGIATQTKAGLMVPVLRQAQTHDLWSTAAEINRLAEAARNGQATRDELSGSTITLTSLGALGGIVTTPVINHPEVAIVGINRIVERPMMRSGMVVARQMMNLSSSFDHRVVDGQHAAEFIQLIRSLLESPALLFVE